MIGGSLIGELFSTDLLSLETFTGNKPSVVVLLKSFSSLLFNDSEFSPLFTWSLCGDSEEGIDSKQILQNALDILYD